MIKAISSKDGKAKLSSVTQKHLHGAWHFSKREAVTDGVLVYRDEFMDNPDHHVLPDDIHSVTQTSHSVTQKPRSLISSPG